MRLGRQTVAFENAPTIFETSTTVGKKEGEGPLKDSFDMILEDDYFGCDSWEKAETKLQIETAKRVIEKSREKEENIDYILAGDLLNQCVGTHYTVTASFSTGIFNTLVKNSKL